MRFRLTRARNYWSDYDGRDGQGDGIGDSPYVIDAYNTDHFPLMGMFHDFNVSWVEPGYSVELVSNSSISAFDVGVWIEHPDDSNTRIIKFNATGEAGTAGFCRVCIPTTLLNASYTVLLNGTEIPFSARAHSEKVSVRVRCVRFLGIFPLRFLRCRLL